MYDEYAVDKSMRINLGIRRRLAPMMENDRRRVVVADGLLLSMPGTPSFITATRSAWVDNVYLGDRNGVRTPMQWSGGMECRVLDRDPERFVLAVDIPIPFTAIQAN